MKPYAAACDRNREPILEVLKQWFTGPGVVLEIGGGTGQHAIYFAENLPHLTWVCTDREENLEGIRAWFEEARSPNLKGPFILDVADRNWPVKDAQYAFSANTAHIMGWPEVTLMFEGVGAALAPSGVFCLYGPFNRDGAYTSESNRQFDASLQARDPRMGLRNDRDVIDLASACGLAFIDEHAMPANNRVLVFRKSPQP